MEDDKFITIAIRLSIKKQLDNLKVHPNQSYGEIIMNLIKEKEDDKNGSND